MIWSWCFFCTSTVSNTDPGAHWPLINIWSLNWLTTCIYTLSLPTLSLALSALPAQKMSLKERSCAWLSITYWIKCQFLSMILRAHHTPIISYLFKMFLKPSKPIHTLCSGHDRLSLFPLPDIYPSHLCSSGKFLFTPQKATQKSPSLWSFSWWPLRRLLHPLLCAPMALWAGLHYITQHILL